MVEQIDPVRAEQRLAQLMGDDFLAQAPALAQSPAISSSSSSEAVARTELTGNPFEDMLNKAIESLEGVSRTENYANQVVDRYLRGEAEIADVMIAQSKMSVMVQLAVTTVNTAVSTFKEITQIQV
jgi:flagellar hook-basal body complex protein FliE